MEKYITKELDEVLDVKHLKKFYVINSINDYQCLKNTAKYYGMQVPEVLIYNFQNTLIEEAKQVPGYESIPVPVMNMFMEHGNNFIVSIYNSYIYYN